VRVGSALEGPPEQVGSAGAPAERAASVLIADDQPGLRSLLRPLLERGGFYVCADVGDAAAAIDAAIHNEPDLCLIDIRMPGNGIAATAAIASMVPRTKIVILTVSQNNDDLFRAIQAGAVGYLLKDKGLKEIAPVLRRVLQGEAFLSGELTARVLEEFRLRGRRKWLGGSKRSDELLTRREWEVLELLAEDLTTAQIAQLLSIREVTVRTHISTMLRKYQVSTRQAALRRYRER
jgi:two-component system nitrate/nitrite response regulator NarL